MYPVWAILRLCWSEIIKLPFVFPIFNTLRPRQDGRHFPDGIFKWIFLNENLWISIEISLKFVPRGLITNIPALVQTVAWRRPGDKPLSKPMMVNLLTHVCVTRPQWVNILISISVIVRDDYVCACSRFQFRKYAKRRFHHVSLGLHDMQYDWQVLRRRQALSPSYETTTIYFKCRPFTTKKYLHTLQYETSLCSYGLSLRAAHARHSYHYNDKSPRRIRPCKIIFRNPHFR